MFYWKINRSKVISTDQEWDLLTDQKLDQQLKSWINISKVRSTDQKLDQKIKNRSRDQMLDEHIKCYINISKLRSTDQKVDQQIKH